MKKRESTLKIGGSWRNYEAWSAPAKEVYNSRRVLSEPEIPINKALTEPVVRLYGHINGFRSIRLANNMFNDIYEPTMHPKHIMDEMMHNDESAAIYGNDIADLISIYGDYGVVYAEEGFEGVLPEESFILHGGFAFLVPEVGMPLKEFLLWYRGTTNIHPGIVPEWSGIPHSKIRQVYSALLVFFRNEIKYELRHKARCRAENYPNNSPS